MSHPVGVQGALLSTPPVQELGCNHPKAQLCLGRAVVGLLRLRTERQNFGVLAVVWCCSRCFHVPLFRLSRGNAVRC